MEVLVPISIFAMSFGIAYIAIMSGHREKMSMLEKGINPKEFENEKRKGRDSRKGALVLIAVGLGLIVGRTVDKMDLDGLENIGVPAFVCLFIGIALYGYYLLSRKDSENRA